MAAVKRVELTCDQFRCDGRFIGTPGAGKVDTRVAARAMGWRSGRGPDDARTFDYCPRHAADVL